MKDGYGELVEGREAQDDKVRAGNSDAAGLRRGRAGRRERKKTRED